MAVYKLEKLYNKKPEYGARLKALNNGKYKYVRQTDISSNIFPTFVNDGPLLKNGDVLISRAGANSGETYIHEQGDNHVFAGFLVRYSFNNKLVLNRYFYYWTKSDEYKKQVSKVANSGSTMPKLNPPVVGMLEINLPPLPEQEKIIEIIKPIGEIITNLENIKNNALRLADSLPITSTNKHINFKSIKTGKHNADFENSNGHYNFYTCGIKVRKCNSYSFDGKYIILSGNASLYTWWIDGKFDLYQRVYALEVENDFFTSYHSVRNAMRKLRDESSGSVIKYITLNDIKKIELLSNTYEKELSKIYKTISSAERLLDDLDVIKNSMIKLLVK